MNKSTGVKALKKVVRLRLETLSSIGRLFGIHASQVSRIAAGKFERMSGNALKICIYAQSKLDEIEAFKKQPELADRLNVLTTQLALKDPYAAHALLGLLETLIEKGNSKKT
jgi:hypothetical protein